MSCATCANDTVIVIRMRIAGEEVAFQRCSTCDANAWSANEGSRTLDDILDLARVR